VSDDVRQPNDLAGLIEQLGPNLVELVTAPAGRAVPVSTVGIVDPHNDCDLDEADLLLGIGVDGSVASATTTISRARRGGANSLALKMPDDATWVETVTAAASREDLALVRVERGVSWSRLLSFLQTLCAAGMSAQAEADVQIGDLFGLANAIAAMAGGPVTIEDLQSNVLAYSNIGGAIDGPRRDSILGRRVPDAYLKVLKDSGVFRRLWSSADVIRVSDTGMPDAMRNRLAIAVRAGGQALGSIWVAEADKPLGPESEEALRHGARMAAVHLMHRRHGRWSERRQHGETLRRLLDGEGPPLVHVRQLGMHAAAAWTVLAIAIGDREAVETLLAREALIDLVGAHCDITGWQSCQAIIGGRAFALIAPARPGGSHSAVELATRIATKAETSFGLDVRVGVSDAVTEPSQIAQARREAEHALETLLVVRDGPVAARLADVAAAALFVNLRQLAQNGAFPWHRQLAELTAYDATNGTDYIGTLRAYLDNFGDVAAAAAAMFVHQNTFRYRLRRLIEIAKIDLKDADTRVAIELELRLEPTP